MNGFCFDQNNCNLWILLLLVLCVCKSGCLNGILNSCYALPIALALICCFCKNGGSGFFNTGCGCK